MNRYAFVLIVRTHATDTCHDPSSSIVVDRHSELNWQLRQGFWEMEEV